MIRSDWQCIIRRTQGNDLEIKFCFSRFFLPVFKVTLFLYFLLGYSAIEIQHLTEGPVFILRDMILKLICFFKTFFLPVFRLTLNLYFLLGYSAIEIQYGTAGPVFITHYEYGNHRYELCSTGYSSQTGETLCQSKGYSYNTYTT